MKGNKCVDGGTTRISSKWLASLAPGRSGGVSPPATRPAGVKVRYLTNLIDLKSPPGNRLEALSGNRKGQHSIRINQQYRLCFRWSEQGADQVEILDYH